MALSSHEPLAGEAAEKRRCLLQDIQTVDWGKQVAAFHFNTKLNHLVIDGCLSAHGWSEECERLVSCLPRIEVLCGWRNCLVDPFKGAREAFPSNRQGSVSDIPGHIQRMWEAARTNGGLNHTGLYHGNLLEILENSGILAPPVSREFYCQTLGMSSTPFDDVEDLVLSGEGEALAGNGEITNLAGQGVFWRGGRGSGVLWEDTGHGTFLSMEGYNCICRWQVLREGCHAIVIQGAKSTHTSVTNLAERVRDACRQKYGAETKCYEFYEQYADEEQGGLCEIVGEEGEVAGWIPVPVSRLPCLESWLARRRVQQ